MPPFRRTGRRQFTSARRARRRGAWNGAQRQSIILAPGVPDGTYLWDDVVSSYLNVQGNAVHQRSLLWITVTVGSLAARGQLAWYVYKHTTDAGNNVPAAMIFSPFGGQAILQKELMDWGVVELTPNTASATGNVNLATITRDVGTKRKFSDTDAILFVIESTVAVTVGVFARTYCSF